MNKKLMIRKERIDRTKKIIKSILENGAYSNINEINQLTKGEKYYNNREKTIVSLGWKFRKFQGLKLQEEFIDLISEDKDFLDFLKINDLNLYKDLKNIMGN